MGNVQYAYINSKILKWAREETPFNIEDVSIRLKNIDTETIKKWENGEELISITNAKKLANLYDVPFASFYLSDIPEKQSNNYIDRRTLSDYMDKEISYELWKEIRYLNSCRENALELLNNDENISKIPSLNSNVNIDEIAQVIRKDFNIDTPFKNKTQYKNKPFTFYREKLEKYGILILQMNNVSVKEIRGLSLNYDVLPIIGINKADTERAKVFTLFHELAHIVRRTSALCSIKFDERSDTEEKTCDKIASEVLVPKSAILNIVKNNTRRILDDELIKEISDKFGVSTFVIIKKLYDLNIITYEDYSRKYNEYIEEFNKVKEKVKENEEKGNFKLPYFRKYLNVTGKLYPSIVLSAYFDGKISLGEVTRTLNIKTSHIENIERTVMF